MKPVGGAYPPAVFLIRISDISKFKMMENLARQNRKCLNLQGCRALEDASYETRLKSVASSEIEPSVTLTYWWHYRFLI